MRTKLTDAQSRVISAVRADPFLASKVAAAFLDEEEPTVVTGPADLEAIFRPMVRPDQESLFAVALNRRHQVVGISELTRGNDSHTIVDPRQAIRWLLRLDRSAYALALAHNHPSGDPSPSQADVEVTHRMASACSIVNVELLDHLILTVHPGEYRSLRELGLVPQMKGTREVLTAY